MTKTRRMRALIQGRKVVVSPGVYDGHGERLVERMGFQTASTTGAGIANATLSQPDIGIRSRLRTPLVSIRRLEEIGVARVSLPRMLPAAAIAGMRQALALMLRSIVTGEIVDRPALLAGIEEITALLDDDRIQALEREFLLPEQLEAKDR